MLQILIDTDSEHNFVRRIRFYSRNFLLKLFNRILNTQVSFKITNSYVRFMVFDQFRVPSTALLNRTGDVDEQGNYVSPFKDKKKRLGEFQSHQFTIF